MADWSTSDFFQPVSVSTVVDTTKTTFYHFFTIFFSSEYAWSVSDNTCRNVTIILCVEFTIFRATFSSNQDDTGIGTSTIDSSSRTVFQDVDRLDVAWKNRREVATRHTVDYVKRRCSTTQRTYTTKLNVVRVLSRVVTTIFDDSKTSNFTLDKPHRVGRYTFVERLSFHRRYRPCNLFFSLCTITYSYNLLKKLSVVSHNYVNYFFAFDSYFLSLITYITDYQSSIGVN